MRPDENDVVLNVVVWRKKEEQEEDPRPNDVGFGKSVAPARSGRGEEETKTRDAFRKVGKLRRGANQSKNGVVGEVAREIRGKEDEEKEGRERRQRRRRRKGGRDDDDDDDDDDDICARDGCCEEVQRARLPDALAGRVGRGGGGYEKREG